VYPGVPPITATVAVPFGLPQVDWVVDMVSASASGWTTVMVLVMAHPFASVMVQVYVPAVSPVAEAPVPPEGAHE
jgi:hypothetical protein